MQQQPCCELRCTEELFSVWAAVVGPPFVDLAACALQHAALSFVLPVGVATLADIDLCVFSWTRRRLTTMQPLRNVRSSGCWRQRGSCWWACLGRDLSRWGARPTWTGGGQRCLGELLCCAYNLLCTLGVQIYVGIEILMKLGRHLWAV